MKLFQFAKLIKLEIPRRDVHDALEASPDQYMSNQEALMKPQVIFGVTWVLQNIPEEETVLRMGWAASGYRMLGAPILGMFVLTSKQLLFVRQDPQHKEQEGAILQQYPRSAISEASESGWPLGIRKLHFTVDGEEHILERMHKENVKYVEKELGTPPVT